MRRFIVGIARRYWRGNIEVWAAAVALFALLGLLPAMAAVVSIYALIADPSVIQGQLSGLDRVLPPAVFRLIVEQLELAAQRSTGELGLALGGSLLLSVYAARSALSALLWALNQVDGASPHWTGWRQAAVTSLAALAAIVGGVTVIALIVALPTLGLVLRPDHRGLVEILRWPVLIPIGVATLSAFYRLGAPALRLREVFPGAFVATALFVVSSVTLSYYVNEWATYESLYGAFGSVMVVLLWSYVSSLVVLFGALVNAELRSPTASLPA